MRLYLSIAILLVIVACKPSYVPTPSTTLQADSIYIKADLQKYGDYYNSSHQVYAIDLLSSGLKYDSAFHISGTGYNLYLSDVFAPKDSILRIPEGIYYMDSTIQDMHFLQGKNFEGSITGTYLLYIQNDQLQGITLFSSGKMTVEYIEDDILLDFDLYTKDSIHYHATYQGAAKYR
jgi:hypothetical protein